MSLGQATHVITISRKEKSLHCQTVITQLATKDMKRSKNIHYKSLQDV